MNFNRNFWRNAGNTKGPYGNIFEQIPGEIYKQTSEAIFIQIPEWISEKKLLIKSFRNLCRILEVLLEGMPGKEKSWKNHRMIFKDIEKTN